MQDRYPRMKNGRRHPFDCIQSNGYADARSGLTLEQCPYRDKRKPDGKLTWSRAHIRAWEDGWHAYHQSKEET